MSNTITNYIVYAKDMPFVIVDRKIKVDFILKKAKEQGLEDYFEYRKITSNERRIREIARNIFERPLTRKQRDNILTIRNKLIVKTHEIMGTYRIGEDVAWEKVRGDHGLNDVSYSEFCRWMSDVMEYA